MFTRYFLILIVLFAWNSGATPIEKVGLELKQKIALQHKEKFKQTIVGGLSGLFFHQQKIYAVSDDRGRFGPARIYGFQLEKNKNQFSLKLEELISLQSVKKSKNYTLLDLEGLIFFDGKWIVSSEGDLNKKPRVRPEILSFSQEGLQRNFVSFPEEFLPNESGVLTQGLKNNMAFEGLTLDKDKNQLVLLSESSLIQDKNSEENVSSYLLNYDLNTKKFLTKKKIYFETGAQLFLYFGASEITYWKENKYFILTRGVSFNSDTKFDCALWFLDLEASSESILKPKLIYDFKTDKLAQNYEGMTFIKDANEEYLVVVSDDNFDRTETTEFLFFKVK